MPRSRRGRLRVRLVALAALLASLSLAAGQLESSLLGEWASCALRASGPENAAAEAPLSAEVVERYAATALPWRAAGGTPVSLDRMGEAVVVAVIDSGVDASHPELADRTLAGIDLVNVCGDGRTDPSGHGTQVAGVLTSLLDTAPGGPEVKILPVRTSARSGQRLRWATAAGVVWAVRHGADVINISGSSVSESQSAPERAAIRFALDRGVVVVAAAGNHPSTPARYPASYPGVISVTSADVESGLSWFATSTGQVDLAAPGATVITASPSGSRTLASGTSLSAPVVSATAALLKAADPSLSPAVVKEILQRTAVPIPGTLAGSGQGIHIVDPVEAVRAVVDWQPLDV